MRTAARPLFAVGRCAGLESSFVGVATAPQPQCTPASLTDRKAPSGQQLPRHAARGGWVSPRAPRRRKPQAEAEAKLWAARSPRLLLYPELVGAQRASGVPREPT